MTAHFRNIHGAGGGGSKKGGGKDASNTLQSRARVRILELVSEGEIGGLVDGLKSVYFDQTPVIAQDDTVNLKGVVYEERKGTPDQEHINGVPYVETPVSVETKVEASNGPVVRTIAEENADAVRVIVRIPSLFHSTDEGMKKASVSYAIDVRPFSGVWTTKVTKNLSNQKTVSPYQIAHRVELPVGGAPWDIRVRRITGDSDDDKLQNETWFDSYVILVEGKFTYPNSALVFLDVDSEQFGSSVPARSYLVDGILCQVPTNYDPIARTYTGIWNGTFKTAWTSNPAWIFYDLITNDRYGLGEFVDVARVDKWGLYRISQYCDEMVFTGFKDSEGEKTYEPRYQFNGVINNRKEAYDVLRDVASAFRGMAFWSLGQIFAVADLPSDPVKLVSPANIVGGAFKYSGTARAARHSVALVSWNNPDDFYRPAVEPVISDDALRMFGWRETSYQAQGCTSRGQAHRLGRWILDVEQNENETVEYTSSFDHLDVRPFDIIQVADPRKAQFRNGGRLAACADTLNIVTLDAPVSFVESETHVFSVELPDGSVVSTNVSAFLDVVDGKAARLQLVAPLAAKPVTGAMWAIGSISAVPRLYRVLTIQETDKHLFKVTGLFHDPNKYARVEDETTLQPIRYTRPRDSIAKPINPNAVQTTYFQSGAAQTKVLLSWTPADDFMAVRYAVSADTPDGPVDFGQTALTSVEVSNATPGDWTFYIVAIGYNGLRSDALVYDYTVTGWAATDAPSVSDLQITNGSGAGTFSGTDVEIAWTNNFAGVPATASSPFYRRNTVSVYDATVIPNVLLREEVSLTPSYVYSIAKNASDTLALDREPARKLRFDVTLTDTLERSSAAQSITVENPAPAMPVVGVTGGFQQIFVSWAAVFDLDYQDTSVWIEKTSGFDPLTTEPKFRGTGGAYSYPADEAVPHYVRVGHSDRFSAMPVNISSEISVTPAALEVDDIPPDVPTGLALDTWVETVAGVDQRVILAASWAASSADDFAYYEIQIKQGGGNYVGFQTSVNSHQWSVAPDQDFTVKVRAVDSFGNASAFSAPVTLTSYDSPSLAELINSGSTTIDGAHVTISGGTTLYDWRSGSDNTKIDGGQLATNSVATNSLTVGNRNVKWEGLQFEFNSPSANKVAWTAGTISYVGDDGNIFTRNISANNATWTTGTLYLYWAKDAIVIQSTTSIATAMAPNNVVLAAYKGNTDLVTDYGRTVIDGSTIKTGSIDTAQIKANAITAGLIAAGAISTAHLQAGSVTADKITIGNGGNWLDNADISAGLANWLLGRTSVNVLSAIRNDIYAPIGGALQISATTASAPADYGYFVPSDPAGAQRFFPVIPGQKYQFSVYAYMLNAPSFGMIRWYDSAGAMISDSGLPGIAAQNGNPNYNLGNYARPFVIATAPAGAVRAHPIFGIAAKTTGAGTASYGFFVRPFFGEATPYQTEPSPWSVGGATKIGPGTISTTSLSAISSNLGAITAGSININNLFTVDGAGATTIKSAASGARIEITSTRILVVDNS